MSRLEMVKPVVLNHLADSLGLRLRPLQVAIGCILPAIGWFLRPARRFTFVRAAK